MTVEADIFNALRGLVANRVYPDMADAGTPRPYVTYQQVGGQSVNLLARELPSKKNGRYQLNCWADTRKEALALALQVEAALLLAATVQTAALGALSSEFEEDTKLYGTRQDFSIWSDR